MGRYPEAAESTFEDGTKYVIGAGATVCEATRMRDDYVLDKIMGALPAELQNKKLRVLELGSGRGGMAKNIALALKNKGILEQYIATNISQVENQYNARTAKVLGLEEPEYLVRHISFDDLYSEGTIKKGDKFDVISSCEAMLHSADRRAILANVKDLLVPKGVVFISDILVNADSPEEDIAAAKARFSDSTLGSGKEYETNFAELGYEKVSVDYETHHLQRHYGLIRHTATSSKKEEMLGPNGVS